MAQIKSIKNKQEIVVDLPNGATLRCGEGEESQFGGYVRIVSAKGRELFYWDKDEWESDPECVMGAIFGAVLAKGV